jgi:hypothetical protein
VNLATEPQRRREDELKSVAFACACGERWTQLMKHYESVRCECGRIHWVLQPARSGPFISRPWPGNSRTRVAPDGMPLPPLCLCGKTK